MSSVSGPRIEAAHDRRAWAYRNRATLGAVGLLAPSTLLLGVLFFYPLIGIVLRSLNAQGNLSYTHPRLSFTNYSSLFSSDVFRVILETTFEIALLTTLICLVIGYPVAYLLAHTPRQIAKAFLVVIMVPFWTSILVRLYAWTIILSQSGLVDRAFHAFGASPPTLLFTTSGVIIGMVHYQLPYMILLLYATMVGIDPSLSAAARSLGAKPLYAFWRVYFPLSLPGVYAGSLLVFATSLGYFVTPAVLGGPSDLTITTYIEQEAQNLAWGPASAMGVMLLVVTLAVFVALNRIVPLDRLAKGFQR